MPPLALRSRGQSRAFSQISRNTDSLQLLIAIKGLVSGERILVYRGPGMSVSGQDLPQVDSLIAEPATRWLSTTRWPNKSSTKIRLRWCDDQGSANIVYSMVNRPGRSAKPLARVAQCELLPARDYPMSTHGTSRSSVRARIVAAFYPNAEVRLAR